MINDLRIFPVLITLISLLFLNRRLVLKLIKPMVFEHGQRFTIRDGKMTLGTGVVTKVLKSLAQDERLELLEGKKRREKRARKAERISK